MNGALLASNPNKGKQNGGDKAGAKGASAGGGAKGAGASKANAKPPQAPLTVEETAQLRAAFTAFDADGSGEIDAEEIVEALTAVKVKVTPEQAALLIAEVDEDGNGNWTREGHKLKRRGSEKRDIQGYCAVIGFFLCV
jgi:hypothetical protein